MPRSCKRSLYFGFSDKAVCIYHLSHIHYMPTAAPWLQMRIQTVTNSFIWVTFRYLGLTVTNKYNVHVITNKRLNIAAHVTIKFWTSGYEGQWTHTLWVKCLRSGHHE
jgi:hypothetical protein